MDYQTLLTLEVMMVDADRGIFMSKGSSFAFEVVSKFIHGKLGRREAAQLLNLSERSVSYRARRIERQGVFGSVHGNRGKRPWNKTEDELKTKVLKLVQERYFDFNLTHCLEMLTKHHGVRVGYPTLRRWCHERKLVKRARRRRGIARRLRERMPCEGLLLQMDGSAHEYVPRKTWHLIAAIDDATSSIPYAEFFEGEETLSCMKVLRHIIEKKGVPAAIYVDKAGCFGGTKRQRFNQFRRACDELGIQLIAANSPEAKGRIERAWDTFQDRLIPELRIHDIWTMPKANYYLQNTFLVDYWARKNTVLPRDQASKYKPLPAHLDLDEILCLKDSRLVSGDHTIQWRGDTYQLDWSKKGSIRGRTLELRTYPDESWRAYFAGDPVTLKPVRLTKQAAPRYSQGARIAANLG